MKCAVESCTYGVSPCHCVCKRHWRAIPTHLRDPLVRAFRNRGNDVYGWAKAVCAEVELAEQYAAKEVAA